MQSCKLHAKPIIFDSGATHVITPCKSDIIKGWKAEKLSIKGQIMSVDVKEQEQLDGN